MAARQARPRSLSFILMDDPEHARLRRMVTAPFIVKRIETMRPAVHKIVNELIDTMLAGPKPVDLVAAFALPVPSLVISGLLGVPYDDHEFFQDNSKTMVSRTVSPEQRTGAVNRLAGYLDDLMGDKLVNPGEDPPHSGRDARRGVVLSWAVSHRAP
jgi:cytochrome P450